MSNVLLYQLVVANSANHGEKIPVVDDVSHFREQKVFPRTPFVETCKEFEFQTDCNPYVYLRHLICFVTKTGRRSWLGILKDQRS